MNNEGVIIIQESVVVKVNEIHIVCDHFYNPIQDEQAQFSMPTSELLFQYTTSPMQYLTNKQTNKLSYLSFPLSITLCWPQSSQRMK